MNPNWSFPYASQRMPVLARNVVSTSQPLAAQAGLEMLRRGGNAADAAIAAAIALTVVEPTSNGIGSDAFAILWDGDRLHGLNASGRSPKAWTRERFAGLNSMPISGWDSVTVPGAVSAWVALSTKFGRLPFADLFAPAIHYAREGYAVAPVTAAAWKAAMGRLNDFWEWRRVFCPKDHAPAPGELVQLPDHALTLEEIAETRGESFYRGPLARRIADAAREGNGALSEDDLGEHEAQWVKPISVDYRGHTIHEIPPNGQGIATLMALGCLEHLDMTSYLPDTPDCLHVQIEAMKLALSDAYAQVGDPDHMQVSVKQLLDADRLSQRAHAIDLREAKLPKPESFARGGTVLLCAADSEGMMVSFIQSNFWGFGSGIVVPSTGIALQNRGYGFSLERGHPNEVGGGKLPFHTIIPGFITRGGEPLAAFGMMGGAMQAQGHTQLVVRMIDQAQNPQAAIDAPRWQVFEGRKVGVEAGVGQDVITDLQRRGHLVEVMDPRQFGGAQVIWRMPNRHYCAASDPRKDGQAVGF